jgi:cation:H+ antiporter
MIAAIWLRLRIAKGGLLVWHLLVNCLIYLAYLLLVLY